MFEPGLTNSEILFKKSLRSGTKSYKQTKKQSQYQDIDQINKVLCQIVYDLQNKNDSQDAAIQLITEEQSILRQHLSFQVFIPEAKTHQGDKILKENNLWIIILVVFNNLCKEKSKYVQYLSKNIENSMMKHFQDIQQIKYLQQQAQQILDREKENEVIPKNHENQSGQKTSKKQLKVSFTENKENEQYNCERNNFSENKKNSKQQHCVDEQQQYEKQSLVEFSKQFHKTEDDNQKIDQKIEELTKQFSNLTNDSFEINDQQQIQPEVEQIIEEQVKELEKEIHNRDQSGKKMQRQSFTEKLFTRLGFKAWRSEQKQIKGPLFMKIGAIRLLNGLDSSELNSNLTANIEKIIISNINDNGFHSIAELSKDNPQELLEWGQYALIQINDQNQTNDQYQEDMQYYKQLVAYRFRQEKQIYIPFKKYMLVN